MHYSSVFPKLVKLLLYPFITYLLLSLSLSLSLSPSLTYQISKNTSFFFPFSLYASKYKLGGKILCFLIKNYWGILSTPKRKKNKTKQKFRVLLRPNEQVI